MLVAALLAIYVVLGVLYESYSQPLTILSTLPSAGVGALLALMATGTEFSLIAFLGILLLIGIVKKKRHHDGGLPLSRPSAPWAWIRARPSLTPASLRFRPIMMTTCAAIAGALPLAIAYGDGTEMRRPLGIAIVRGAWWSVSCSRCTRRRWFTCMCIGTGCIETGQVQAAAGAQYRPESRRSRVRPRESAHVMRSGCPPETARFVRFAQCLSVAAGIALAAACAVGPDYHRPTFDAAPNYKEAADWKPSEPNDVLTRGPWWEIYKDDVLNQLEKRVDISNENVKAAVAAFDEARALVAQARAGYLADRGAERRAAARIRRRGAHTDFQYR